MRRKKQKFNKVCIPSFFMHSILIAVENAQLEADAKLAASLEIEEHEENGMMMEWYCPQPLSCCYLEPLTGE